jgi:hypothetical protein
VVFLFLFFSLSLQGQMLDNREGNAFTDKPFFNCEFIRINKIHTLNGKFTYKKPGDVLRVTQYMYVYNFDELGRLIESFETRKDDGTADTTWNRYEYDHQNRLIVHKKGDPRGLNVNTFAYDEQGRITEELYAREFRDTLTGEVKLTVLNRETMRYENYDRQQKKTWYNSYDLPYKQEFSYYDENGYLIERIERLMMTSVTTTHRYAYNEKGLIAALRSYKGNAETAFEEFLYVYDESGNLEEKQHYRNGQYITEIEILYNERSHLLTYVITRDVATNFIMILGFKEYAYF